MIEIRNYALERLRAGELSLGVGLRQARTVDIGKAMKTAGFDWLFIDMEHTAMDVDMAVQISVAAQDAGITPIVRGTRLPAFCVFGQERRVQRTFATAYRCPHCTVWRTSGRFMRDRSARASGGVRECQ